MLVVTSKHSALDWFATANKPDVRGPLHITALEKGVHFDVEYERKRLTKTWIKGKEVDPVLFAAITGIKTTLNSKAPYPPLAINGVITDIPSEQALLDLFDGHRVQRMGRVSAEWLDPLEEDPKISTSFVFIRERILLQHKMRSWVHAIDYHPSWTHGSMERELELLMLQKQYRGVRISINPVELRAQHAHPDCVFRFAHHEALVPA